MHVRIWTRHYTYSVKLKVLVINLTLHTFYNILLRSNLLYKSGYVYKLGNM